MENLPYEIVTDILSRLPAKSLGRCKCVSKSLRSLISDPQFSKTHLNRSLIASNIDRQGLFINSKSLYTMNSISTQELDYFPLPPHGAFTVGSCNGLVCMLFDPNKFVLLNPSTRAYNYLPLPGRSPQNGMVFIGFGYDSINDDYKVVRGIQFRDKGERKESIVMVFSLKSNSWKRILEIPRYFIFPFPGPFVNGALHWEVASLDASGAHNLIVSFDLAGEKFGEVPLPCDEDYNSALTLDYNSALTLGVLEGCLCMTRSYNGGGGTEIWTMKEYGVRESWTKLVKVTPLKGIENYLFPLCCMKNGNILLQIHYREKLAEYNPKEELLTMIEVPNDQKELQVVTYVESLVSPFGENKRQKRGRRGHTNWIKTSWNKRKWFFQDVFCHLELRRTLN